MTRIKLQQLEGGGYVAARPGTPTIVVYGATEAQARQRAARQLRSWRRYVKENRPCSPAATSCTRGA